MRRAVLVGIAAVVVMACGGETNIDSGTTTATGGVASSNGTSGGPHTATGGSAGSEGHTGSGGAAATAGGTGGTGGTVVIPTDCTDVIPCGGDVVGTWNVVSSCLELTGDMNVSLLSLGCVTAPVTGYLQTTGTFVANVDGSYTDNTTTTGSATLLLSPTCQTVASVPVACNRLGSLFQAAGWTTGVCTDTDGQCNCLLTTEQQGGMGAVVPYTEPNGSYTTDGNTLTAANVTYSYCTSGDTLSLTPQRSALTGTVVLQREGTTDSGDE